MSIRSTSELAGIQRVSEVVAITLKKMREYALPGMSTFELDVFGGNILASYGARSAPHLAYRFPGFTCISINEEVAHGLPSKTKFLRPGDLINIDVSAELDDFWADNGGSFVLGADIYGHNSLVDASRKILKKALGELTDGVKIADLGRLIETEAKKMGYGVIRNLAGHGVGRSLHEKPEEILNCYNRFNHDRFRKNSVVAVETFISTHSSLARTAKDGWTLTGNKGGYVAQHEHTVIVTDSQPLILTESNEIW